MRRAGRLLGTAVGVAVLVGSGLAGTVAATAAPTTTASPAATATPTTTASPAATPTTTATPATTAPAPKITICHSTGDPAHPYQRITVSRNALRGHTRHADDLIPAPATGCAPVAPVDLCPNIAGDQATVPAGMIVDPASGDCITPVVQQCNTATTSGGAGVTTTVSQLGAAGPTSFLLTFDAYQVPDRFQVFYENAQIYDSGYRGDTGYSDDAGNPITVAGTGAGSATVTVPAGTATSVTVVVTGGNSGTQWTYTVSCPTA